MLCIRDIAHTYPGGRTLPLPALELDANDHCLLLGPSGSGKTTLLHIVGGLLRPQSGCVSIGGTDLTALRGNELDRFRGRQIGIVFQRLHLIPSLTVMQNLIAAQYCSGLPVDKTRIRNVLGTLGIGDRAEALPSQLSQGQAQRATIARAVVNRPRLILADEPTSSLDDGNAARVMDLLCEQARACDAALLIATHDARAKAVIERRVELEAAT